MVGALNETVLALYKTHIPHTQNTFSPFLNISFRSEGSKGLHVKPQNDKVKQSEAASGLANLWNASEEGRLGANCSKIYPRCPFTASGVMAVIREVAEGP